MAMTEEPNGWQQKIPMWVMAVSLAGGGTGVVTSVTDWQKSTAIIQSNTEWLGRIDGRLDEMDMRIESKVPATLSVERIQRFEKAQARLEDRYEQLERQLDILRDRIDQSR